MVRGPLPLSLPSPPTGAWEGGQRPAGPGQMTAEHSLCAGIGPRGPESVPAGSPPARGRVYRSSPGADAGAQGQRHCPEELALENHLLAGPTTRRRTSEPGVGLSPRAGQARRRGADKASTRPQPAAFLSGMLRTHLQCRHLFQEVPRTAARRHSSRPVCCPAHRRSREQARPRCTVTCTDER